PSGCAGRIVAKAMRGGNRLPLTACGERVGARGPSCLSSELRPCPSIRTALAIRLLPVRRRKAVARNDSPSARDRDFLIGTGDLVGLRRGEAMIDLGRGPRPAGAVALHRLRAGGAREQMLFGALGAVRRAP